MMKMVSVALSGRPIKKVQPKRIGATQMEILRYIQSCDGATRLFVQLLFGFQKGTTERALQGLLRRGYLSFGVQTNLYKITKEGAALLAAGS